jgi:hypothetical protein
MARMMRRVVSESSTTIILRSMAVPQISLYSRMRAAEIHAFV